MPRRVTTHKAPKRAHKSYGLKGRGPGSNPERFEGVSYNTPSKWPRANAALDRYISSSHGIMDMYKERKDGPKAAQFKRLYDAFKIEDAKVDPLAVGEILDSPTTRRAAEKVSSIYAQMQRL